MGKTSNIVGDRGENVFRTRITQYGMFSAYFLGEKAPIEDIFLEINDSATPYSCLVQIKSTEKGYTKKDKNLKVTVSKKKFEQLLNRPLPTYVAGVDLNKEVVFITPAFNKQDRQSSMKTNHKLDFNDPLITKNTLDNLKKDIINYWNQMNVSNVKSTYKSQL